MISISYYLITCFVKLLQGKLHREKYLATRKDYKSIVAHASTFEIRNLNLNQEHDLRTPKAS